MERNPDLPLISDRAAVAAAHSPGAAAAVAALPADEKLSGKEFDEAASAAPRAAAAQIELPTVPGERLAQRLFRRRADTPPFRSACHL